MADKDQAVSPPDVEPAGEAPDLDAALSGALDEAEGRVGSVEHESEPAEDNVSDETPEVSEEPEETPQTDSDATAEPEQDQGGGLLAPEHWPEDRKSAFSGLPRRAQELFLEREREFQQGLTRLGQENAEVRKSLDPIQSEMQRYGVTPGQFVGRLVAWHQYLQQDPVTALKGLGQLYGVNDLSQLAQPPAEEDQFVDPTVQALRQELQQTQQSLQGLMSNQQQAVLAQQQQAVNHVRSEIERLRTERDDQGNLKRPYFDRVRHVMGAMMHVDPNVSVEDAYDRAAYADPQIRASLMPQPAIPARQSDPAVTQRQVEDAKRQRNLRSSPPPGRGRAANGDLDTIIGDALNKAGMTA